jgi:plastocyanin
MRVRRIGFAAALAASASLVTSLAGCGGSEALDSGASSHTTVVIKKEKAGGATASTTQVGAEKGNAPPTAAGGFGTLKGRVVFAGSPPTLQPLISKGQNVKDPICAKETIPDEKLVVGSDNGVANVVIFLPKPPPGAAVTPPPSEPATLDNKGCHFVPHVLLARVGQTVKILNDDVPLQHNTHIYSQRTDAFNSTIPKEGKEIVYKRAEPEPCEVKCDIHAWMRGFLFPIDHPFAAVTGPNGEFEIKNVPTGEHSFRIWAEGASGKYLSRGYNVTIKPGETTNVEIKYEAGNFAG